MIENRIITELIAKPSFDNSNKKEAPRKITLTKDSPLSNTTQRIFMNCSKLSELFACQALEISKLSELFACQALEISAPMNEILPAPNINHVNKRLYTGCHALQNLK